MATARLSRQTSRTLRVGRVGRVGRVPPAARGTGRLEARRSAPIVDTSKLSRIARRRIAAPPMAAVDRVGEAVHAAVLAWAEAFIERVMARIVPSIVKQDATEDDIDAILASLDDPDVSRALLESAFKSVDRASSDDLRVIGVQTETVVRNAERLQAEWLRESTDLIRATEDVRRRVERILKDPVSEGRSVADIKKLLIEEAGYAAGRAELTARTVTLQTYGRIQEQRQRDAGFTKYVWTTSLDERVREDHAELDGTVQEWDDPPIVDRRTGRRGHPGSDFQCLPPNSQVAFASPIDRAFRRRYRGQAALLIADSGETLQCTPNHPVLTASGWKAAQAVQVGEYVLKARLNGSPLLEAQIQHREAAISDVFEALALVFGFGRQTTVASEFHNDASADEQVDVVDVDRKLLLNLKPSTIQELGQFALADSDSARFGASDGELVLSAVGASAHGRISGLRERLALFFGRCREAGYVGSAASARLHTASDEECANGCPRDAVALREAFDRGALPLHVQAFILREWLGVVRFEVDASASVLGDAALAEAFRVAAQVSGDVRPGTAFEALAVRVVEKRVIELDCHVFNVSSACDWYVAQRLFVHNCRCSAVPYAEPDEVIEPLELEPPPPALVAAPPVEAPPPVRIAPPAPAPAVVEEPTPAAPAPPPVEDLVAQAQSIDIRRSARATAPDQIQQAVQSGLPGKTLEDLTAIPFDAEELKSEAGLQFLRKDPTFLSTGNVADNFGSSPAGLPQIQIEADGSVHLINGRHRLTVAREVGLRQIVARVRRYGPRGGLLWEYIGPIRV